MGTIAGDIPVQVAEPALSGARTRIGVCVVVHTMVDFYAFTLIPLITVLEGHLDLTRQQGALLVAMGTLCAGSVQPMVAWISDRLDTRLIGAAGFAMAAIAIGSVGFVRTYGQLLAIQALATAGIGAFHPVTIAAVGQLAGRRRSLLVAVFYTAGMVGGVMGNVNAPNWVRVFGGGSVQVGLRSLAWLIVPGLVGAGALLWAIRRAPHRHASADEAHRSLAISQRRRRWHAVMMLYVGNCLRFIVNMSLVILIVRWTEHVVLARAGAGELTDALRTQASTINGPIQGAMILGMGTGAICAGFLLKARYEKAALALVPMVGALAALALPHVGGSGRTAMSLAAAGAMALLCGVGFGGMIPATIAIAQRLLPHRTGLASSLMMGGGWAVAVVGPPMGQWIADHLGLAWAFGITGGLLAVSGLAALGLPRSLILESAGESAPPAPPARPR